MKNFVEELSSRELVSQTTNGVEKHLNEPRAVYCGFDPTADSLHIGSLVPLLAMKRLQKAGHKPIILVGGATGMIGDPSFKSQERKLNTEETVKEWTDSIKQQVSRFVDFNEDENSAVIVNNFDWTKEINVIDFLRDYGKHFHIKSMIQKESVKQRIQRDGEGISFTEFSYMLLQSLDFSHLNKSHNCTVQIGGSDQWGNMVGGIELTKKQNGCQAFAVTLPLITKSDGTKFGKTESGTIWLDEKKTSPYNFFQFWLNTSDDDVYKFLKFFTFLEIDEIKKIEEEDKELKSQFKKPKAQLILAREVTEIVHGKEKTESAERISASLFEGDLSSMKESDFEQLSLDGMEKTEVSSEISLMEMLVGVTGMVRSNKMAREHIKNKAVRVNGNIMTEPNYVVDFSDAFFERFLIIKLGKKKYHMVTYSK